MSLMRLTLTLTLTLTLNQVLLFFGQKFAPKLIMFTCLTAALRIDPLGDGARMNFAMFRSFITISACVIYYVLGLAYTKLAHPSFLRQLFGRRHLLHTLYLYGLRALILYAYVMITWEFFDEYLNKSQVGQRGT